VVVTVHGCQSLPPNMRYYPKMPTRCEAFMLNANIPWIHPISIFVNPLANSHDSKYCLCVCFDQHRSSWKNQTMNRSPWLKLPHITMISWILGFFLFPLIWVFPKMDHQFKSLDHQFQNVLKPKKGDDWGSPVVSLYWNPHLISSDYRSTI